MPTIELPRSRPPAETNPETDPTESGNGGRDRINIAGDTVTQATAHLPEEQRDLIRWVYGYAKEEGLGWKELESRFAISRSTFWKIFNDGYRNENGDRIDCSSICKTIGDRKELIEKRENLRRVPFVETSIFKSIYKVALEARDMQVISLIYGESQIGKTEAQKEIKRRHNHGQTVYVRVPASAGVQWFIKEIAGQCHIKVRTSGDQLRERVIKYFDHTKLLLIDEAHLFFETYQDKSALRCLEFVREIHDRCECGVAICGTNVFKDELEEGQYHRMLKQFRRRGILELQLPDVAPRRDLDLFATAYGLRPAAKGSEEETLMLKIAREDGLGRFTKFLAKARGMAAKKNEKFTWANFIRAHDIIRRLSINGTEEA